MMEIDEDPQPVKVKPYYFKLSSESDHIFHLCENLIAASGLLKKKMLKTTPEMVINLSSALPRGVTLAWIHFLEEYILARDYMLIMEEKDKDYHLTVTFGNIMKTMDQLKLFAALRSPLSSEKRRSRNPFSFHKSPDFREICFFIEILEKLYISPEICFDFLRKYLAHVSIDQLTGFEESDSCVPENKALSFTPLYYKQLLVSEIIKSNTPDRFHHEYVKCPQHINRFEEVIQCRGNHSMVLTPQKKLFVWGSNHTGSLGVDNGNNNVKVPTEVTDIDGTIIMFASGDHHTVILTDSGLFACGANDYSELGLQEEVKIEGQVFYKKFVKMDTSLIKGKILSIKCGASHTLVLTTTTVYGCGDNRYGQITNRDEYEGYFVPILMPVFYYMDEPPSISQIAAGMKHSLFLSEYGKVYEAGNITTRKGDLYQNQPINNYLAILSFRSEIIAVQSYMCCNLFQVSEKFIFTSGANQFGHLHGERTDVRFPESFENYYYDNFEESPLSLFAISETSIIAYTQDGTLIRRGDTPLVGDPYHAKGENQMNKRTDKDGLEGDILAIANDGGHCLILTTEGLFGRGMTNMYQLGLPISMFLRDQEIVKKFVKIPLDYYKER